MLEWESFLTPISLLANLIYCEEASSRFQIGKAPEDNAKIEGTYRVCMKGTFRTGDISGSSALDSRSVEDVAAVIWLTRLSSSEDLLRLCRDVRLSSKGFISGGSLEILRNITPR